MTGFPTRTCFAVTVSLSVIAQSAWAAPIPEPYACQKAKVRATARAFSCLAREEFRAIRGSTTDFAECTDELASAFDSAELRAEGLCITTADSAVAQAQIEDAIDGLLVVLQASLATDSDSQRCLGKQIRLVQKYAACQANALSRRIGGAFDGHAAAYFRPCSYQFRDGLDAVHAHHTCVALPASEDVTLWAGGGFAYIPFFEALGDIGLDYFGAVLSHGNLSSSNFAGAGMIGVDARRANFTGADLTNSRWFYATMDGTDFAGADMSGALVRRSSLTGALLGDANLDESCWYQNDWGDLGPADCPATLPADWICQSGWLLGPNVGCGYDGPHDPHDDVDFSGANLTSADFTNREFDGGTFVGANLTSAVFHGAEFWDVDLGNCNFSGTDLSGVVMRGCNLTGADMATAIFNDGSHRFRGISLTGCPASLPVNWDCVGGTLVGPAVNLYFVNLSGIEFSGVVLTGAIMESANLTGARFVSSDLTGAYLVGANLSGVHFINSDLTGANLAGANLSGVIWQDGTCPDGTHPNDQGDTCCGHHVGSPPAVCN